MENKELQIIGQGTYGCVFRPNIECSEKKIGTPDFLSKIQASDKTAKNEIEISKKLPKKSPRFAGIINTCNVTVGKIGKDGVEKCKMLQQTPPVKLISNKIKYAGKETISTYLQEIISREKKEQTELYIKEVINSHLYLLRSLFILNISNVLHLDIKYNNVMVKDRQPVIIDFGLSYDKKNINIDVYKKQSADKLFGIAVDYYIPWCFEIILLSHVSRYLMILDNKNKIRFLIDKEKEMRKVSDDELKTMRQLFKRHIDKHIILQKSYFTTNERARFTENMMSWINGFTGKSWRDVWNIISSSVNTWDNYSLSVMYLIELEISGLMQISEIYPEGFLSIYIKELKKTILSQPDKRSLPEDTSLILTRLFSKIKKTDHIASKKALSTLLKESGNREKMVKQRTIVETDSVQESDVIKKDQRNK
jgi:serine/threonine protein kinase